MIFKKAFDRIGAHVILSLLQKCKVEPKIFDYVKSYLNGRLFRVKINGTYSALFPLHNGFPQSSPLSVMIFKIAFTDISKMINKLQYVDHFFCKKELQH